MAEPAQKPTFHLGLVMAGAVSAGAYTGGVMDYLFETLDLWERAKKAKLNHESLDGIDLSVVPDHEVMIDAMGGTSAGGMTTALAAIHALKGDSKPITDYSEKSELTGNVFYDSWVNLDDLNEEDKRETFEKTLDVEDLKEGVKSGLNSKFIDAIGNRAFVLNGSMTEGLDKIPNYLSKHLELLLAHTMIEGIPLEVSFPNVMKEGSRSAPSHTTFEHFMMSHFKLSNTEPAEGYLWLNPYEKAFADRFKKAAIATGAFPAGLEFRVFNSEDFSESYTKKVIERILFRNFGKDDPQEGVSPEDRIEIDWTNFPGNLTSRTVDGGAINNEVFAEVGSIVRERAKRSTHDHDTKFAVVMIDPFPDVPTEKDKNRAEQPDNLIEIAPRIIKTLWNQSKVKRNEIIEQKDKDHFRSVIFPVKYKDGKRMEYPIASGSLEAFGGFLDVEFRKHDFHLGRNNARNFVRYWFSLKVTLDENGQVLSGHPIHLGWTSDMVERFKMYYNGEVYLPIIPDLSLKTSDQSQEEKYHYTVEEMPLFDAHKLEKWIPLIKKRLKLILGQLPRDYSKKEEQDKSNLKQSVEWINYYFRKTWYKKLRNGIIKWGAKTLFAVTKGSLAKLATEKIVLQILQDLESKELLKPMDKPKA